MSEPSLNGEFESGEAISFEDVYTEFRQMAKKQMARELFYSTLQGTALLHEAWLRVGGEGQPKWESRRHLYAAVSTAMRRILTEKARKRKRIKHGGDLTRAHDVDLDLVPVGEELDERIAQIGKAMEKFDEFDPEKAELVRLRYFFNLTLEEAAKTLGISRSTAKRWWVFARSWLYAEMMDE